MPSASWMVEMNELLQIAPLAKCFTVRPLSVSSGVDSASRFSSKIQRVSYSQTINPVQYQACPINKGMRDGFHYW